jgi:hypothetical protein
MDSDRRLRVWKPPKFKSSLTLGRSYSWLDLGRRIISTSTLAVEVAAKRDRQEPLDVQVSSESGRSTGTGGRRNGQDARSMDRRFQAVNLRGLAMAATPLPNFCLAKEVSQPHVFFVCGGTTMWIRNAADFAALGFRWDKVRTVPDGTLEHFVERSLVPPGTLTASDVFLASSSDSGPHNVYAPPWKAGKWYRNSTDRDYVVARDVLVVGWLTTTNSTPNGQVPYVNDPSDVGCGVEDVFYEIIVDPDFVEKMYGPGGLSTRLNGRSYLGNPGPAPKALTVEDCSEVDGSSKGVTFNSFNLPTNTDYVHGELNAWHVSDLRAHLGGLTWHNRPGRGPAPAGWVQVNVAPSQGETWFPFDFRAPGGDLIKEGDYVLLRGTIWQDQVHGGEWVNSPWHSGATVGHEAWVEIHPVDWVVRLQPRPAGLRKTGHWAACATKPGVDEEAAFELRCNHVSPSTPTRQLCARHLRRSSTAGSAIRRA